MNNRTVVGVDPGKHSIVYMMNDDMKQPKKHPKNRLQYTNIQRKVECGGKRKVNTVKPPEVVKAEQLLSNTNSRSIEIEKFQEYLQVRHQHQVYF